MARYNNGMIYTNDNCIGCNKCIFECPVIGANVSVYEHGQNRILVNEKKCIHCGHCLSACTHNAREYRDDTEAFFEALSAGKNISIAVAPSFYINYPEKAKKVLGYLRYLGAKKIYDVGYGADIATYCHLKYFEKKAKTPEQCPAFLSKSCPAIVNYAECCVPEAIESIIPIHSPVICLGIYVHKYLGDQSEIAFVSPCVSKKDEIESPTTGGVINYNVTFKHLMQYLENIVLDDYYAESDLEPIGLGELFPIAGGFKEYIETFLTKDEVVLRTEGLPGRHEELHEYCAALNASDNSPSLVDILNCTHGCLTGPATESSNYDVVNMLKSYKHVHSKFQTEAFDDKLSTQERRDKYEALFSSLDVSDFECEFIDRFQQPFHIPESTYDEIFNAMHKYSPQERSVNCHSCGYASCREMVTAIAYGYNHMENCIHYTKDEIARLYYTDPVTEISNKAAFLRDTEELLHSNPDTKYVICTADINNFTAINDMYGFENGNKVLQFLAQTGTRFVEGIGVCARLDTDHFALCFPYSEDLLEELRRADFFDCHEISIDFPITLRFGIYIVEDIDEQVDKMLDLAAIAMSKEGDRSRNTFSYYNNKLRQELIEEANITSQMREALDKEEFYIYLQPQYNHATGELIGAEALCRWIKSDGSILSPAVFIPVFEKNGFIIELDRYMWEKTFALVRKWLDAGIAPVPVSVNISRISLQDVNLSEVLIELGRKYQVNPALIHLEITESAYISNQMQIINIINTLRGNGFLIAMDDFGSGYSSLNTLKNVPIDILKLDMGFLRGDEEKDKGGNIISSVIRMAQSLKLYTIAEGVETVNQANFLKSVGCDMIQGFLYAKPMPVSQYEELFTTASLCHTVSHPNIMTNINIDSFFNPDSSETKMFDYYTGAAILFEYEKGKMSIVRINDKYIRALGLDKESFETIRHRFMDELMPESRKHLTDAFERAIRTGQETICLTEHRGSNSNKPIWIKSHIWCVAANGERYTMYGLAEDISAEKNSETALLEANKQMEMIMENLTTGVCLFKGYLVDTPEKQMVLMKPITVNNAFVEFTGYTREEIAQWTEENAMQIMHPKDIDGYNKALYKAIKNKKKMQYVYRIRTKAGTYELVRINSVTILEEDGTIWMIANLTEG